ncbi:FG-GAP-like repeat-containing protein [Cerasicoccus frondis]|uniref:FG-GAP-like repeat-containing protein n=1 Tax=Cerasicoccus frondis TaxID=490090 RepID=UPI002852D647|nr:FG-GAP-like repeat-containing protein [Cerasicoccus frondis]
MLRLREVAFPLKAALSALLVFFVMSTTQSATVALNQESVNDTDGTVINAIYPSTSYRTTGETYKTSTAPTPFEDYQFTHWTIDAYPLETYRDAWGRSINPASFVLLEETTTTAHYLPTHFDSDGDLLPDWYEIEYFGDLDQSSNSDDDNDGTTLMEEFQTGAHPRFAQSTTKGGIFWADSSSVAIDFKDGITFLLRSEPSGLYEYTKEVDSGYKVTSKDFAFEEGFGYWTLDGVRQEDSWGVAVTQLVFQMVNADREGIAYLFSEDSDADDLPDYYEYFYFGDLSHDRSSDPNNDGVSIGEDYDSGASPVFANYSTKGGIFWADSNSVSINFGDFHEYRIASEPEGIITTQIRTVVNGHKQTTNSIEDPNFAYWSINGIRVSDDWGVSLNQVQFVVDGEDMNVIAHFLEGDSDNDLIADSFEYYYYGSLDYQADSDSDNDGHTLLEEYNESSSPIFKTSSTKGGVFWGDSQSVIVDLQFYENLSLALVDDVLTPFFATNTTSLDGVVTDGQASTAVADWDGDGDFDLFVAHAGGLWIYENIGNTRFLNFHKIEAPQHIADLIAAIDDPVIAGGDWNGDGLDDLVVGGDSNILYLIPSQGSLNTSGAALELAMATSPLIPALADFNDDGYADLLVMLSDGNVRYFQNTESAPFFETYTDDFLGQPVTNGVSLSVSDIDQDNTLDVLASDQEGRIWEFHNDGANSFNLISKVWGGAYPGFAQGLKITAVDLENDGDTDLIAGLWNGSLISLSDPHVGRPSGLEAASGADSILLTWNPSWQSRIAGYFVYRAEELAGPFTNLLTEVRPLPEYLDQTATIGDLLHYRVTAITHYLQPGNSKQISLESSPSEIVSAGAGNVSLSLRSIRGQPAKKVKVLLSIDNSLGLTGEGLSIDINYDPAVITPREQTDGQPSVLPTSLSRDLVFSDNGATANGLLSITGLSGTIQGGSGKLFVLEFHVEDSASLGLHTTISFQAAELFATAGYPVSIDLSDAANLEVTDIYFLGDLNGDGQLAADDEDLLKTLTKPNSPTPTEFELIAGDLNGDGALTTGDIVLLKRLLKGLSIE